MKYLFHTFLLIFIIAGLVSCDDLDLSLEENGSEEVLGVWKERYLGSKDVFLLISNTELNFYELDASQNCAKIDANQVVKRDGTGFFQVQKDENSDPIVYTLTNNDGDLHLRLIDDSSEGIRYFWPSAVDVSTFTRCLEETEIQGKWELTNQDGITYVDILDDSVTVFSEYVEESCFEITGFKIDGRNGNIYKLLDEIATGFVGELYLEIKRTQVGLEITLEENGSTTTDLYNISTVDFSTIQPDCGDLIPNQFIGLWETQANNDLGVLGFHFEINQDTVRNWIYEQATQCFTFYDEALVARRGDTFFMNREENTTSVLLSYEITLDEDVLVVDVQSDIASFEDRFVRSVLTSSDLEAQACSTSD